MAIPALEILSPRRASAASPLSKVALFHFPFGAHPEDWDTPVGAMPVLPPMLTPLGDYKDQLVVLSGLSSIAAQDDLTPGNPHGMPSLSVLTGAGLMSDGGSGQLPTNRSVDFAVAEVLGPAAIPSLYTRVFGAPMNLSITGPGAGTSVAPFRQPHVLFTQLFGDGDLSPEALQILQERRLSVLDFMTEEIDSLQAELGAADRQRLEFHLTTVRQLELRAELSVGQCAVPDVPPGEAELDPPDEALPQRADDLMDLAMVALRCDITNVLLFSMGTFAVPTYSFLEPGVPPHDAHQTSHLQAGETREEQRFWYLETNRYHISKFARLLDLLAGTDGGEPILDRTAAVCFSEMGMGAVHSPWNLPVFAAGGGLRGGRRLHSECTIVNPADPFWSYGDTTYNCTDEAGQTPIANLWLTLLQALGGEVDSFGESTGTIDSLW